MSRFIREVIVGAGSAFQTPEARTQNRPGIIREQHELEESLRIMRKMRDVGGIRPIHEVLVNGIVKTIPEGPDFIERVNGISNRMTIDGKRMVHTVEEINDYVGSHEFTEATSPTYGTRPTSGTSQASDMPDSGPYTEDELKWDGKRRFNTIDALFEEIE